MGDGGSRGFGRKFAALSFRVSRQASSCRIMSVLRLLTLTYLIVAVHLHLMDH